MGAIKVTTHLKSMSLNCLKFGNETAGSVTSWEVRVSEIAAAGSVLVWSAWWSSTNRGRKFTCDFYVSVEGA